MYRNLKKKLLKINVGTGTKKMLPGPKPRQNETEKTEGNA